MLNWPIPKLAVFLCSYAIVLMGVAIINRREFRRCPEKGERYRALPIGYKLLCWCCVIPLFAGAMVIGPLFIPGVIGYVLLEAACVRWYQKVGLLSESGW